MTAVIDVKTDAIVTVVIATAKEAEVVVEIVAAIRERLDRVLLAQPLKIAGLLLNRPVILAMTDAIEEVTMTDAEEISQMGEVEIAVEETAEIVSEGEAVIVRAAVTKRKDSIKKMTIMTELSVKVEPTF